MTNPFEFFEQASNMTRMWTDFMTKMWSSAMAISPTTPPPEAAREARSATFGSMSQMFDQMMRSPMMLEGMKQWMDAALTQRKQFNEMLTRMHQAAQMTTSQDIDSLMLSIRHLESRVLERLDEIDARLGQLESGEGVEGNGNGHTTAGRRRMRRTRGEEMEARS